MKKFVLTMAAALLMAAPAFAADSPVGKWSGEQQGRQGTQPVSLEIKADGSGTMTVGQQPAANLEGGKVSGAKVAFTMTRNIQDRQITIKYSGEAKGDDLTLTREIEGMGAGGGGGGGGGQAPQPLALKRAK